MDRRTFLGLMATVAAPALAQPKDIITQAEFQSILMKKLKKDYNGRLQVLGEPAPGILRLKRLDSSGSEPLLLLEPFYAQALRVQANPQEFMEDRLNPLVVGLPGPPVLDKDLLMPRLFAQEQFRRLWPSDNRPSSTALHPRLCWTVVVDQPLVLWAVGPREERTWGMSETEVQQLALENLARRTDIPFLVAGERQGVWVLNRGDGYDAERMLVVDLLQALRAQAESPLTLVAPSHNWLVVARDTGAEVRARLTQVSSRIQQTEPSQNLPVLLFNFDQRLEVSTP
ncbi:hypothetical protein [Candidatus Cyanaurora vandensis]|uniref:hypothetical protein n=1 Tax=Candidatus Cyanaurora vandensis TaxID=2714958 RepID=UPI00257B7604|nr:hypothetical protein [Candidatus Cyanaurora vandensis]